MAKEVRKSKKKSWEREKRRKREKKVRKGKTRGINEKQESGRVDDSGERERERENE